MKYFIIYKNITDIAILEIQKIKLKNIDDNFQKISYEDFVNIVKKNSKSTTIILDQNSDFNIKILKHSTLYEAFSFFKCNKNTKYDFNFLPMNLDDALLRQNRIIYYINFIINSDFKKFFYQYKSCKFKLVMREFLYLIYIQNISKNENKNYKNNEIQNKNKWQNKNKNEIKSIDENGNYAPENLTFFLNNQNEIIDILILHNDYIVLSRSINCRTHNIQFVKLYNNENQYNKFHTAIANEIIFTINYLQQFGFKKSSSQVLLITNVEMDFSFHNFSKIIKFDGINLQKLLLLNNENLDKVVDVNQTIFYNLIQQSKKYFIILWYVIIAILTFVFAYLYFENKHIESLISSQNFEYEFLIKEFLPKDFLIKKSNNFDNKFDEKYNENCKKNYNKSGDKNYIFSIKNESIQSYNEVIKFIENPLKKQHNYYEILQLLNAVFAKFSNKINIEKIFFSTQNNDITIEFELFSKQQLHIKNLLKHIASYKIFYNNSCKRKNNNSENYTLTMHLNNKEKKKENDK